MTINRDDNITGVKSTESAKEQLFNMIGMQSVKDVLEAYPKFKEQYLRTFKKMLKTRKEKGLKTSWENEYELYNWWVN